MYALLNNNTLDGSIFFLSNSEFYLKYGHFIRNTQR